MVFNILKLIFIINIGFSLNSFAMEKKELDPHPQYVIGKDFYNQENYKEAIKSFRPLAVAKYSKAQYKLGKIFGTIYKYKSHEFMDKKLQQIYNEATKWFLFAAQNNHPGAPYQLALIYNERCETHEEAIKWLLLAAKQNHLGALYKLGIIGNDMGNTCVSYGLIDERLNNDPLFFMREAAKQNYGPAQYWLGKKIYRNNDHDEALKWLFLALENYDSKVFNSKRINFADIETTISDIYLDIKVKNSQKFEN